MRGFPIAKTLWKRILIMTRHFRGIFIPRSRSSRDDTLAIARTVTMSRSLGQINLAGQTALLQYSCSYIWPHPRNHVPNLHSRNGPMPADAFIRNESAGKKYWWDKWNMSLRGQNRLYIFQKPILFSYFERR